MALKAKVPPKGTGGDGTEFEKPPPGNHPAVCVAVVDLGTRQESYQGGPPKPKHKLYIAWELLGVCQSGTTRHHVIGQDYVLSLGEQANLRQMLDSWFAGRLKEGDEPDLTGLAGCRCLLNVAHKTTKSGKQVAAVKGVTPLPEPMKKGLPKGQHKPLTWEIGSGEFPNPDWLPYLFGRPVLEHIDESDEVRLANGRQQQDARNMAEAAEVFGNEPEPEDAEYAADIPF